jgi:hypothetical protein
MVNKPDAEIIITKMANGIRRPVTLFMLVN